MKVEIWGDKKPSAEIIQKLESVGNRDGAIVINSVPALRYNGEIFYFQEDLIPENDEDWYYTIYGDKGVIERFFSVLRAKKNWGSLQVFGNAEKLKIVTLPEPPENSVLVDVGPPMWLQFGDGWLAYTRGGLWIQGDMKETNEGAFGWQYDKENDWWVVRLSFEAGFIGGLYKFRDGKLVNMDEKFDDRTIVSVGRGVMRYVVERRDGEILRRCNSELNPGRGKYIEEELLDFVETKIEKDKPPVYIPKYYLKPVVGGFLL